VIVIARYSTEKKLIHLLKNQNFLFNKMKVSTAISADFWQPQKNEGKAKSIKY